jgi:hypothetical protein
MNDAPANSVAESKPPGAGWSRNRWLAMIALVFVLHVALIFLFGQKKSVAPRAVANVPMLHLAGNADELLALNDPTLFALPHRQDFASAVWQKIPPVKPPSFRWTESPRWLPLSADDLGAEFGSLIRTQFFAANPSDFKPPLPLSTPMEFVEPMFAQHSTMQIEGELAQRELPAQISLTNWPYANVLKPSEVQALVDASGNVISTVILASSGYEPADQRALAIVRALRFNSSSSLMIGRIIFNWHTVPPTTSP